MLVIQLNLIKEKVSINQIVIIKIVIARII
jgi:hypothetical protein